jgi:transposase
MDATPACLPVDKSAFANGKYLARLLSPAVVGIDVGKDQLVCSARSSISEKLLWSQSFPNTKEGVRRLLARVPERSALVLEPTGRYGNAVVKQAQHAGHTVLLAPPREAKNYLRSRSSRAKTDRLDSEGLSQFALSTELREYRLKDEALEKVDQLLSARKSLSSAIARMKMQRSEMPYAADRLTSVVDVLEEQLAALDEEIEAAGKVDTELAETIKRLDAVPGIGLVTATRVATCLVAKRFATAPSFVAYIGLDVQVNQSGRRKGELGLSHHGDAELRRLLYLSAQSCLRCHAAEETFKAQYQREQTKGMSTTAALNAVARKIAKLCWSLHKHGTEYTPDRVYVQPNQAPAAPTDAAAPPLPPDLPAAISSRVTK